MGKEVRNKELGYKIMKCIKEMDYKKGEILLQRKLYKDVKYLAYKKFIDLDDLRSFETSKDEEETLNQACQFAIERLKKLGYVKEESYDASGGGGTGDEKQQYRLLIDTKDLIVKQGVGLIAQEEIMKQAHELKNLLGV